MKFLEKVLHVPIRKSKTAMTTALPNYLLSRYVVYKAELASLPVVLAYSLRELGSVYEVKTHVEKLREHMGMPVVLVLERIRARQRQGLIDAGIPFVVEGKQCRSSVSF